MYGTDPMGPAPVGDPTLAPPSLAPPPPEPVGDPVDESIAVLRQALEEDGSMDPDEKLLFEQITTLVAKFKAGRHKQEQAALGGSPTTAFLKRTSGV